MLRTLIESGLTKDVPYLEVALYLAAAQPLVLDAPSGHLAAIECLSACLTEPRHTPAIQLAFLAAIRSDHKEAVDHFLREHKAALRKPFAPSPLCDLDFAASHNGFNIRVPCLQDEEDVSFAIEDPSSLSILGKPADLFELAIYLTVKYVKSEGTLMFRAAEIAGGLEEAFPKAARILSQAKAIRTRLRSKL